MKSSGEMWFRLFAESIDSILDLYINYDISGKVSYTPCIHVPVLNASSLSPDRRNVSEPYVNCHARRPQHGKDVNGRPGE